MKLQRYLQHLIETEASSLTKISNDSGIDLSVVSKVVRGKRVCGRNLVVQLLTAFTGVQQQMVLQYWLMDQIPDDMRHLIAVQGVSAGDSKCAPCDVGTLEGALSALGKHAEENEAVRSVVVNMAKAFADTPN